MLQGLAYSARNLAHFASDKGTFVIVHDRRWILHLNATPHPTGAWTSQQLREAFPYDCAPKYLIFDRASNFDGEVIDKSIQSRDSVFKRNGPASEALGRVALRNGSLAAVGANCSIT
jgi:hypothetical protein